MWEFDGRRRPPFAEACGVGQESVWDYPRPPRLVPDRRRVAVRLGELTIADSKATVRVLETASPPTFYIPPEDVQRELLETCAGRSTCEWKGAARYWRVVRNQGSAGPHAWCYLAPTAPFRAIAGYFSFYPSRVECCVDGERVRAQPGHFYGGWVTAEIVGPFKGTPGTSHW